MIWKILESYLLPLPRNNMLYTLPSHFGFRGTAAHTPSHRWGHRLKQTFFSLNYLELAISKLTITFSTQKTVIIREIGTMFVVYDRRKRKLFLVQFSWEVFLSWYRHRDLVWVPSIIGIIFQLITRTFFNFLFYF